MGLGGFPAVDAAIGLAALFFLLSTVCSSINEGISSALGWRAKTLEDAIRNMLGEAKPEKGDLTEQLFEHWRIKSLVRDPSSSRRRRNRPSYLPPKAFSRALAEVVAVLPKDVQDTPDTLWKQTDDEIFSKVEAAVQQVPNKQLRALVGRASTNAENTLDDFRRNVETTFDDSMERASGWYKRKVQIVIVIIAAVVAIGLNVDTVRVATHLLDDTAARSAVAAQAQGANAADALKQVQQLQLPVGWGDQGPQRSDRKLSHLPGWGVRRLPGWILTIAALSLGAPFWFDLLSRFARLRSAGVPEKPRSLSDTAGARGT